MKQILYKNFILVFSFLVFNFKNSQYAFIDKETVRQIWVDIIKHPVEKIISIIFIYSYLSKYKTIGFLSAALLQCNYYSNRFFLNKFLNKYRIKKYYYSNYEMFFRQIIMVFLLEFILMCFFEK